MRDILDLFLHAIVTLIRLSLSQLGGLPAGVAESVLMRDQVPILNRGRIPRMCWLNMMWGSPASALSGIDLLRAR